MNHSPDAPTAPAAPARSRTRDAVAATLLAGLVLLLALAVVLCHAFLAADGESSVMAGVVLPLLVVGVVLLGTVRLRSQGRRASWVPLAGTFLLCVVLASQLLS